MDPIDPTVPRAVLNAVILQAMADEAYDEESAQRLRAYQYCDMTPVVVTAVPGPIDPDLRPGDIWFVEVQYSSKGGRAGYGVDRNHVPHCYVN